MSNSSKRKSSTHATSPPPSKRSPLHAFSPPRMYATSPPHSSLQQQQQQNRPLTTAAAAVAAMKRGTNASQQPLQTPYRRQSNSTAPPSRQGSVETDREGSVAASTQAEDEAATSGANKDEAAAGKEAQSKEDAEADDDEKEDVVVDFNANMQAQMEKAKEDMKVLLENFSDDQLQRYEGYRRSALNRTNVKRLVSQVLNQQCSQTMAFVVAGFSKVYVGEIVEKAKEIMEEWGDNGAIRPEHLREAHRRYKRDKVSSTSLGRRL
ncbi:transcription factor TFIID complex subunit Taf11 [Mucor ambiguus]|uniref:Transcription initiation factor TFIID subunit 11 n=1 Tax=Mucor ambiguus TaxID=91626 RepID=A0A0C9MKQ1_9FUNG|nr:transcription factor TFIID complex subunit Taf11 [Mucor ambiguus]